MRRSPRFQILTLLLPGLLGCSGLDLSRRGGGQTPAHGGATASACDPARDRQAILAMAGGYQVHFRFDETVGLTEGYELEPRYEVDATELVIVAEDSPGKIVLQHLLAMGQGRDREALKHWRQDWTFEPKEVLQYRGGDTWGKDVVPEGQRRCAWSQHVYGIEDGPRYGSWGRWVHQGGVSAWTSQDTWRPLPRREKKRSDYDVIVGINRHTIAHGGWIHEQDNGKLVLRGKNQLIAREHGVIPYRKTTSEDWTNLERYWKEHQAFWAEVRSGWDRVIASRDSLTFLPSEKTPKSLNAQLIALQEPPVPADPTERQQRIVKTIESHLESRAPLAAGTVK